MDNTELLKELEYFKSHQEELVSKYLGKYLIIKDEKVHGAYNTQLDAYTQAKDTLKFKLGTFIIQHCIQGEDAYTSQFYSRVYI